MRIHGFPRRLAPIAGEGTVTVVVEAPASSRNKYKFEPEAGAFGLHKVLPQGMVFPHDYGFVPGTAADDGDPIDILVLGDAPTFVGCTLTARLVGVIRARQTEDGKSVENDRLIGVLEPSRDHAKVKSLADLGDGPLDQIEHFFTEYHGLDDMVFEPLRRGGPDEAMDAVEKAIGKAKTAAEGDEG